MLTKVFKNILKKGLTKVMKICNAFQYEKDKMESVQGYEGKGDSEGVADRGNE